MGKANIDVYDEDYENEKQTFTDLFASLRSDLFMPVEWSKEKKDQALDLIKPSKMRTSLFTSIPMLCRGNRCTFAESCPLLAKNLHPQNKPCPIEMSAVQQFVTQYMLELGVDADNLIEVSMVRDLVDQEIQQMRKTWLLSQEHFIQENVVGVDPSGKPIMRKELHLAVEMEDRIMRRKKSLREQLLATREARARVGQGTIDTAQEVAKLLDAANKINSAKQKALRAKLGYEDTGYDEYIDAQVIEDEE